MSRNRLIPIASVACCMSVVLIGIADDNHATNAKIDELHSEKLSILEDIVTRYEFGYSKGRHLLEELIAAKHDLLLAKLSIADSQADRMKLQKLIIENRGELVGARIAANRLGNNTEVDILAARVEYIDAKIALQSEASLGRRTE